MSLEAFSVTKRELMTVWSPYMVASVMLNVLFANVLFDRLLYSRSISAELGMESWRSVRPSDRLLFNPILAVAVIAAVVAVTAAVVAVTAAVEV